MTFAIVDSESEKRNLLDTHFLFYEMAHGIAATLKENEGVVLTSVWNSGEVNSGVTVVTGDISPRYGDEGVSIGFFLHEQSDVVRYLLSYFSLAIK